MLVGALLAFLGLALVVGAYFLAVSSQALYAVGTSEAECNGKAREGGDSCGKWLDLGGGLGFCFCGQAAAGGAPCALSKRLLPYLLTAGLGVLLFFAGFVLVWIPGQKAAPQEVRVVG